MNQKSSPYSEVNLKNGKSPVSQHSGTDNLSLGLPRISFVMIVLNGMPFIRYAMESVYDLAHEIIIIEGAVSNCMFAAGPEGSSTDGTVEFIKNYHDPYSKIKFVQGKWPEKLEMQNKALEICTGNYVWLLDSDEVYRKNDILKIYSILAEYPSITQVNFIFDNFWRGFDYIVASDQFIKEHNHIRRIFKFEKGAYFTTHRPPTMFLPSKGQITEEINCINGFTSRALGIYPCHYSYVYDNQVAQKIELYNRYGWGKDWKLDMNDWFYNGFLKWTPDNKEEIEKKYAPWTGDKKSYTKIFRGQHPEVMSDLLDSKKTVTPLKYNNINPNILNSSENYILQGKFFEAKLHLLEILDNDPLNIEALNDCIVINILEKQISNACLLLFNILDKDPENEIAYENLKTVVSFIYEIDSHRSEANLDSFEYESVILIPLEEIERKYLKPVPSKTHESIFEKFRAGYTEAPSAKVSEIDRNPDAENYHFQINFDLNDGCNLNCIMCGNVPNKNMRHQSVMEYSQFESRFLRVMRHADSFQYGCYFEPLMVPYFTSSLFEIKKVLSPDIKGNIITNGTLLTAEKIKAIIDSDIFSNIRFSIDAVSPELYGKIRSGAKLEKVINNIDSLINYKKKTGSKSQVELNFTIMRQNICELPKLISLAKHLGVDSITTHKLAPDEGKYVDDALFEIYEENIRLAEAEAARINIKFQGQKYNKKDEYRLVTNRIIRKECGYFNRKYLLLTVFANGNISSSCKMSGDILGNLSFESFDEILHGMKMKKLLKSIEYPDAGICAACHMFR